jgi:hypothetical protein
LDEKIIEVLIRVAKNFAIAIVEKLLGIMSINFMRIECRKY